MQTLNRSLQIVLVHLCLTALGGLLVLVSLLAEPSEGGGFLGFSAGRWAALLANSLALAGALFGLYRV